MRKPTIIIYNKNPRILSIVLGCYECYPNNLLIIFFYPVYGLLSLSNNPLITTYLTYSFMGILYMILFRFFFFQQLGLVNNLILFISENYKSSTYFIFNRTLGRFKKSNFILKIALLPKESPIPLNTINITILITRLITNYQPPNTQGSRKKNPGGTDI